MFPFCRQNKTKTKKLKKHYLNPVSTKWIPDFFYIIFV